MKNYKNLRIITLISHLLIIFFIAFFIKFEGKLIISMIYILWKTLKVGL